VADIDFTWFLDFTHGHAEYYGPDVKAHANRLASTLNCQVDVYKMDYSFSVKAPAKSKESAGTDKQQTNGGAKPKLPKR